MAVLYWPSELPQFSLRDGYLYTFAGGRESVATDSGFTISRPKGNGFHRIDVVFAVERELVARFERFWLEETKGVLPFNISNQLFDGQPLLDESGEPILDEQDQPLIVVAKWLVRFALDQEPRVEPFGVRFRITMQLEILPTG
jgi:hypothetical protein